MNSKRSARSNAAVGWQKFRRRASYLAVAVGTGLAGIGAYHQARADGEARAFTIVAFGSSSTEGIGASRPALAYPAQVERRLNDPARRGPPVTVINRGIGGEDIDDMLVRLQADILDRKPDLVIWQVGSNDPLRGVPLDRFEAELREGIAAIRRGGAEVILLEPQWCPKIEATGLAGPFLSLVRKVGADEKVDVVRRYDLMQSWIAKGIVTQAGLIGADGLHMTDRGYALLADEVSDEIAAVSSIYRGRRAVITAGTDGAAVRGP